MSKEETIQKITKLLDDFYTESDLKILLGKMEREIGIIKGMKNTLEILRKLGEGSS